MCFVFGQKRGSLPLQNKKGLNSNYSMASSICVCLDFKIRLQLKALKS